MRVKDPAKVRELQENRISFNNLKSRQACNRLSLSFLKKAPAVFDFG
jgi:hypothetical protein